MVFGELFFDLMASSSDVSIKDLFLLSNICNLISIRLDSSNFVLWKFQFTSMLHAYKLFGFVDGSHPAPPKILPVVVSTESSSTDSATSTVNPSYEGWLAKDQALMTLINATLSAEALAYIVGCNSSQEEWEALEKHYSSSSRTNIINLKSDLQSISKKADESIDSYIKRIKEIKDKLANVSSVVNNEDLLIYALNGLSVEYNTFRTSMRTRSQSVSFEELHVLLKSEEYAIEKQSKREDLVVQPTAMYATQPNQFVKLSLHLVILLPSEDAVEDETLVVTDRIISNFLLLHKGGIVSLVISLLRLILTLVLIARFVIVQVIWHSIVIIV